MAKAKRHKNKKAIVSESPIRDTFGLSGIESYLSNIDSDEMSKGVGKMILLEPREWLDYACIGVSMDNGNYRAVYDLNIIEYVYACHFAYYKYGYKNLEQMFDELSNKQWNKMLDESCEFVDYNIGNYIQYKASNSPIYIRSNDPKNFQFDNKWHNCW